MNLPPRLLPIAIDTWIFDLDNTLYPASHSLFPLIDVRIRSFISRHLDLAPDAAYALQKRYYRDYGTTLRGLMSVHHVDPRDFLDYVHDIDHSVLAPVHGLDAALAALPGRKLVFTNGSHDHAVRVLERLGISRHFDGIFDIVAADFIPKPDLSPYEKLGKQFALDFTRTAMVEDLERNLVPAAQLGMTTIWFKQDEHPDLLVLDATSPDLPHVHHITGDLVRWLEQVVDFDPQVKSS